MGSSNKKEQIESKILDLYWEGKSIDDICAELSLKHYVVTGVVKRRCIDNNDFIDSVSVTESDNDKSNNNGDNESEKQEVAADNNNETENNSLEKEENNENNNKEEKSKVIEKKDVVKNESDVSNNNISKLERYIIEKNKKAPRVKIPAAIEVIPEKNGEISKSVTVSSKTEMTKTRKIITVENTENEVQTTEEVTEQFDLSELTEFSLLGASTEQFIGNKYIKSNENKTISIHSPSETTTTSAEEMIKNISEDVANDVANIESIDGSSVVLDKMKAFAMSQIEMNQGKIAELEMMSSNLVSDFTSKLEKANNDLNKSQQNFDSINEKLEGLYSNVKNVRDEYNKKLASLEEQYNKAVKEVNEKYKAFEENSNKSIGEFENIKNNAQADLNEKKKIFDEINAQADDENNKFKKQIDELKQENARYQEFFV